MIPLKQAFGLRGAASGSPWWASWNWLTLISGVAAFGLLMGLFVVYVRAALTYPYYLPTSIAEEWAYGYITSSNFLKFGFLNSGFLQDVSSSPFAADHPYVYTHMPAGPDILMAVILWLTGGSYFLLRVVLASLFLVGIWFYYRFVQILFEKFNLHGAGLAILIIGPNAWMQIMERSVYALFPLLAFSPFVALSAYYATKRRAYLVLTLAVVFLSSLYIEYSLLIAVIISWALLYWTGLFHMERRHLMYVLSAVGCGIFLHLLQNVLFLGPEIFLKDVLLTLGNRAIGFPPKTELVDFYKSVSILHHGSSAVDPLRVLAQIKSNLTYPFSFHVLLAISAGVVLSTMRWRIFRSGRLLFSLEETTARFVRSILLLVLVTSVVIVTPVILFPAYSQEVTLAWSRSNLFFLALVEGAIASFVIWGIAMYPDFKYRASGKIALRLFSSSKGALRLFNRQCNVGVAQVINGLGRSVVWGLLVLLLGVWIVRFGGAFWAEYKGQVRSFMSPNKYVQLEAIRKFGGELYMTDANNPIIGFFVNAPGFGVCDENSIGDNGQISQSNCHMSPMRQWRLYEFQEPRYFFLLPPAFMPGFAPDSMLYGEGYATLRTRLNNNYDMIFENEFVSVYDLKIPLKDKGYGPR